MTDDHKRKPTEPYRFGLKEWFERGGLAALTKKYQLGATGQNPQGKLHPSDQGELKVSMGIIDNAIVVNFGKDVSWLGFDKNTATQFATELLRKAEQLP